MVAEWKTATKIGEEIGMKNIGVGETRKISAHVCLLNGNKRNRTNGRNLLLVPGIR